MSERDWDTIVAVMGERRLTRLVATAMMTDAALEFSGSPAVRDVGFQRLARLPRLEHVSANAVSTTDRGR